MNRAEILELSRAIAYGSDKETLFTVFETQELLDNFIFDNQDTINMYKEARNEQ